MHGRCEGDQGVKGGSNSEGATFPGVGALGLYGSFALVTAEGSETPREEPRVSPALRDGVGRVAAVSGNTLKESSTLGADGSLVCESEGRGRSAGNLQGPGP
jgi:hypothetical protein